MFRWFHIVAIIIAIGTSLIFGYGEAGGAVALFIILVPFEKMFRRHDQPIRRAGLRADLTYAILAPLLNVAGVVAGVTLALLFFPLFIPALFLRPLVLGQPGWLVAVEAIVLLDTLIYWTHRLSHEVGFFWRFHSIHHSSDRVDWISGIRSHPFDGVIIIIPAAFLVVAGFALEAVGIAAVVQAVLGLTAHANIGWRLRPLHRIVMTPEFHHWHHSSHPEAIHTNYPVFLPLWDMVWGGLHAGRSASPVLRPVGEHPAERAGADAGALAFGPRVDPTHEVALAAPIDGFRLFLVRSLTVVGASTLALLIVSLLVPSGGTHRVAWLLPALAQRRRRFDVMSDR